MIDEKKLIEAIVNTPSECLDSYSVSSVQQGIQYGCATRQNEIIDIINKQPKTDWIPCEERLPSEENEEYLVFTNKEQIFLCFWTKRGWNTCKESDETYYTKFKMESVIAWQPLPAPYKKEGADDGNT